MTAPPASPRRLHVVAHHQIRRCPSGGARQAGVSAGAGRAAPTCACALFPARTPSSPASAQLCMSPPTSAAFRDRPKAPPPRRRSHHRYRRRAPLRRRPPYRRRRVPSPRAAAPASNRRAGRAAVPVPKRRRAAPDTPPNRRAIRAQPCRRGASEPTPPPCSRCRPRPNAAEPPRPRRAPGQHRPRRMHPPPLTAISRRARGPASPEPATERGRRARSTETHAGLSPRLLDVVNAPSSSIIRGRSENIRRTVPMKWSCAQLRRRAVHTGLCRPFQLDGDLAATDVVCDHREFSFRNSLVRAQECVATGRS